MAEQSAVSWEVVVFKLLQRPEVPLLFPFDLFLNESRFIEKKKIILWVLHVNLFPQLPGSFAHYCEVTW